MLACRCRPQRESVSFGGAPPAVGASDAELGAWLAAASDLSRAPSEPSRTPRRFSWSGSVVNDAEGLPPLLSARGSAPEALHTYGNGA